jgi:hypothetical protein
MEIPPIIRAACRLPAFEQTVEALEHLITTQPALREAVWPSLRERAAALLEDPSYRMPYTGELYAHTFPHDEDDRFRDWGSLSRLIPSIDAEALRDLIADAEARWTNLDDLAVQVHNLGSCGAIGYPVPAAVGHVIIDSLERLSERDDTPRTRASIGTWSAYLAWVFGWTTEYPRELRETAGDDDAGAIEHTLKEHLRQLNPIDHLNELLGNANIPEQLWPASRRVMFAARRRERELLPALLGLLPDADLRCRVLTMTLTGDDDDPWLARKIYRDAFAVPDISRRMRHQLSTLLYLPEEERFPALEQALRAACPTAFD